MTATHRPATPASVYAELAERFGAPAYRRIDVAGRRPSAEGRARAALAPSRSTATSSRASRSRRCSPRRPATARRSAALKVVAEHGWFAARPSGTEDVYKVYAESLDGEEHLERILGEAQAHRRQQALGGVDGAMSRRRVFAIVLAGGEGKRLAPLTADRAKPAVPFGGNYRLIDFALSNLVNAGYRRIVVLTQYKSHSPRPPHRARPGGCRRCSATTSRRCPAQMRRGPHWFVGLGRRDLPEPQPDQRRAAGLRHRVRRRPHLPHGPAADGRAAHRERRRRDRRRAARADRAGRPVRRDRDRPPTARRSPPSARSPRTPVGLPDAPDQVFASMGNYVFTHRGADRGGLRRRRGRGAPSHDIGGNIIPMLVAPRRGAGLRLLAQRGARARPTATAATGATSGRSTPTTTRTWTSSRSTRSSTSTTASGRSSPGPSRCRRRSSSSTTRAAAGTRSTRWSARAWSISGGAVRALGALARRARALLRERRGLRADARASTSAARAVVRRAILDKNVHDRAGRADRRRPRGATASASRSPTAGSS